MLVEINPEFPEPRRVQRAADALAAGEIVAYPTDTIYGLGCDLINKKAVDRLYQLKGIPRTQQLSLICPDLSDIAHYARVDKATYRVLRRFLPGPYTFILEASREVPKMLQSKRQTIGIRVPKSPVAVALARAFGRPILSTSAGPPGGEPCRDGREIDLRYPGLSVVLDTGLGGVVPTTVVDLTQHLIVREGAGPVDELF